MAIVLKRYNQEFTSVSSVLVTHNLGRVPEHIIIFDLNAQHIESPTLVSIVNDSLNVSTVTFSSPQSGSVQIAAEADEVWLANNLTYEVGQANLLNVHLIEVRNETGVTISANKSVYQSGYNTTYNLPLVDLADNTNSAKMPAIGLVLADIGNGLSGYVCVSGVFPNVVNTSSYAIRDVLYVGTSGDLTNVNTGGVTAQGIGYVEYVNASGRIYINDTFKLGYAASGYSGYSGIGTSGYSGISGYTGTSGTSGTSGYSGTSGTSGTKPGNLEMEYYWSFPRINNTGTTWADITTITLTPASAKKFIFNCSLGYSNSNNSSECHFQVVDLFVTPINIYQMTKTSNLIVLDASEGDKTAQFIPGYLFTVGSGVTNGLNARVYEVSTSTYNVGTSRTEITVDASTPMAANESAGTAAVIDGVPTIDNQIDIPTNESWGIMSRQVLLDLSAGTYNYKLRYRSGAATTIRARKIFVYATEIVTVNY